MVQRNGLQSISKRRRLLYSRAMSSPTNPAGTVSSEPTPSITQETSRSYPVVAAALKVPTAGSTFSSWRPSPAPPSNAGVLTATSRVGKTTASSPAKSDSTAFAPSMAENAATKSQNGTLSSPFTVPQASSPETTSSIPFPTKTVPFPVTRTAPMEMAQNSSLKTQTQGLTTSQLKVISRLNLNRLRAEQKLFEHENSTLSIILAISGVFFALGFCLAMAGRWSQGLSRVKNYLNFRSIGKKRRNTKLRVLHLVNETRCNSLPISKEEIMTSFHNVPPPPLNKAFSRNSNQTGSSTFDYVDGSCIDGPYIEGPYVDCPYVDGPYIDGSIINGPYIEGTNIDTPYTAASRLSNQSALMYNSRKSHVQVPRYHIPTAMFPPSARPPRERFSSISSVNDPELLPYSSLRISRSDVYEIAEWMRINGNGPAR
ncbi:hypothetical protein O181_053021 [Austropuccinia psidii MF-1]|uniref:Uncharacterized protein n=1 Tax=Austropuccinia psidii MF-1 TaxID=1389203 RepID=A0A9Q3E6Q9_9BASI|nr:hypothetical protein [Austropuccinia psidii MF-1]